MGNFLFQKYMSLGMHSVKVYWLGENMVKEIIYQTNNWWVDLGKLYSYTTNG
jgi:hypothetical protein